MFKAGQFTAEAKEERKRQRARWRALAKAVKAGKVDALEIARIEYADSLNRWRELHELSEHKPDLLVDRALASAATEKRLAGRHVNEAEAARRDTQPEDNTQTVEVRFYPASAATGANEVDQE